jgi:D-3-phosphoglycerate dehydrogenase
MAYKILVTPRSFGKNDPAPIEALKARGYELTMNPYGRILTKEEMIEQVRDADGVVVGVDPMDADVIAAGSKLKAIAKYGVGTDNIDMAFAESRGIKVTKTVGANSDAVAEFAVTLMLSVARRASFIDAECRKLNWTKISSLQMTGKTLGLIGLGAIGKLVAAKVKGFEMPVLAYDEFKDTAYAAANGIEYVDLETLLRKSDFISVHVPLLPSTTKMISGPQFDLMKKTAVIVNTARGGIIDEDALLAALRSNRIWGAGIDVFEEEPPKNVELLKLDNIVVGSHCAASTLEAVDNMGTMSARNLIASLEG